MAKRTKKAPPKTWKDCQRIGRSTGIPPQNIADAFNITTPFEKKLQADITQDERWHLYLNAKGAVGRHKALLAYLQYATTYNELCAVYNAASSGSEACLRALTRMLKYTNTQTGRQRVYHSAPVGSTVWQQSIRQIVENWDVDN